MGGGNPFFLLCLKSREMKKEISRESDRKTGSLHDPVVNYTAQRLLNPAVLLSYH